MYGEDSDRVIQLYLDDIIPNRFQPREVFDERALKELAVSIKEHGVIQPIIVRPATNGKYEIIAGERRYKATALAGLTKIPAIVRELDDKESSKVALLENLQRKNLNPIEEARTYQKILEIDQMTQEELAKTMGKSQSAVANKLRLLSLPEEVQTSLLKEQISERHARALISVHDANLQRELLKEVVDTKMSVRELEEKVKELFPKAEEQEINNEVDNKEHNTIATPDAFVNSNPLIPTAEIPKDEVTNFGKVTIAPPREELENTNDLLIAPPKEEREKPNDIFMGREDEIVKDEIPSENSLISSTSSIDLNNTRGDANNIKTEDRNGAALDNLLNISARTPEKKAGKFITPAEQIVKSDPFKNMNEEDDYFNGSELSSIKMPYTQTTATNTNSNYTKNSFIADIRKLVEDYKNHGVKIETDEMDFPTTFQVIIKMNKED